MTSIPPALSRPRRVLESPAGRILVRLALVGVLLAAWEFAPVGRSTRFWLSSPSMIARTLGGWLRDGSIWPHLLATLEVMAAGYAIGVAGGIGTGLALGLMPRLRRVLSPFLAGLYTLPKVALAPLFIIVLGVDAESKIALVAITVFFLVLSSTMDGVRDADADVADALRLMGARRSEIIRKLLIPSARPWIFTGMRIAVRYAFTATLLAELIAANRGLGFLIEFNSGNFDATGSYAAIAVLVLCSVALTELLSRLESRTNRWALDVAGSYSALRLATPANQS